MSRSNRDHCLDQIMLWHFRLGHPSFPYLKHLVPQFLLSSFHCKVCELAKQCCKPYPVFPYKASYSFLTIHSDTWGPTQINNISRPKWFISFIDDHTRLIWVYLMKEKLETREIFKKFH